MYAEFMMWEEDGSVIIKKDGGPTTQGDSEIEALLMMADALRQPDDGTQQMMKLSADVFITDSEIEAFINKEIQ
jgi:hypothetical protein